MNPTYITTEELAAIAEGIGFEVPANIAVLADRLNADIRRSTLSDHDRRVVMSSARTAFGKALDRLAEAELSTTAYRNRRIAEATRFVNEAELHVAGLFAATDVRFA